MPWDELILAFTQTVPYIILTMWFFFSLLSEFGPDAFMADDQNSETSGSESFAISRERSISAPDVYRSRIISGHTPLVSA